MITMELPIDLNEKKLMAVFKTDTILDVTN